MPASSLDIGCEHREGQMIKVILADNHAIFRTGLAKVMAMEDDLRVVASCGDYSGLYPAIATFFGSIVIVAASLHSDFPQLLAKVRAAESRVIVIAEDGQLPSQAAIPGICGLFYRDVGSAALLDCVRRVSRGELVMSKGEPEPADPVGIRVRDRLTHKEMQIVALISEGCKNREIAAHLRTSEQVIKNYLHTIFDKIGVSDRLELALFTVHHRMLAEAATAVSKLMCQKVNGTAWFDSRVNAKAHDYPPLTMPLSSHLSIS
jgi:DNA-binding NarL/FixJ family response regulator